MVTDDEKREVARTLRAIDGCIKNWSGVDVRWYISKAAFGDVYLHSQHDLLDRLADLIWPPLQCPHYRSDRHYCSIHDVPTIDREALLALADEMDERAPYGWYSGERDALREYACRIREALGVSDD